MQVQIYALEWTGLNQTYIYIYLEHYTAALTDSGILYSITPLLGKMNIFIGLLTPAELK